MENYEETTEVGPFELHQLEPKARECALDNVRYDSNYLDYDWWDGVYEDFNRIADILGFTIDTRRGSKELDISFSLSYSQGDYASFSASYHFAKNASAAMREYANDKALWEIADELTAMQVHQRLMGLEFFAAGVTSSHGGGFKFDIHDWGIDEIGEVDESRFKGIVRDLNDWLYSALQKEYDWHCEDEQVIEHITANDYKFDERGRTI